MNIEFTTEVIWRNCSQVSMDGDVLKWQVGRAKYYLRQAYQERIHVEFMNLTSDDELKRFVKNWGPLRRLDEGADSVGWYRQKRDVLRATVNLISAVEDGSDITSALLDLAKVSEHRDELPVFLRLRDGGLNTAPMLEAWCGTLTKAQAADLAAEFLGRFPFTWAGAFVLLKRRKGHAVRASLFINNLLEAMWWMMWEDKFRELPTLVCEECGKLILSQDRRRRKYCPGPCAKRKADRDFWRRKKGQNLRYRKGQQ